MSWLKFSRFQGPKVNGDSSAYENHLISRHHSQTQENKDPGWSKGWLHPCWQTSLVNLAACDGPGTKLCGPWANSWGPVPCVPGPEMSGMSGMGLRIMPGIIAIILWWLCVQHILIWSNQHRNATSFYLSEKSLEYQVTGSRKQHCWGSGKGSANICIWQTDAMRVQNSM